jgi:hypothetical protein
VSAKKNPLVAGDGDSRHGTRSGYSKWHCRCPECRAAQKAYASAYYRRQVEEAPKPPKSPNSPNSLRQTPRKDRRKLGPQNNAEPQRTGEQCIREGCSKAAIGDEYCSAACARLEHGVSS